MIIHWFLRKDTQTCEWTFESPECSFKTMMPIKEFFLLVEQLYQSKNKLVELMGGGMNAQAAISEFERIVKEGNKVNSDLTTTALKNVRGQVVGKTDRVYELTGKEVVFDEILVAGAIGVGETLLYNDKKVKVAQIGSYIGLLVDEKGARGPVMKGVKCTVEA